MGGVPGQHRDEGVEKLLRPLEDAGVRAEGGRGPEAAAPQVSLVNTHERRHQLLQVARGNAQETGREESLAGVVLQEVTLPTGSKGHTGSETG